MPILSVYHELTQYEEVGGDMVERINKLCLHQVFSPIIETYIADAEKFNKILFYILHIYSKESKMIIVGTSYLDAKNRVADMLKMEGEFRGAAIEFRCPALVHTVQRYIRLQLSKPLEHLIMKRELYQRMIESATCGVKDEDSVSDFNQMKKNSDYADLLYAEMFAWERRLLEENDELKAALDEIRESTVLPKKESMRIEDLLKEGDFTDVV